ncbi:hypothetical protein Back11_48360 [Paenibacillus baekrokdamisoli]|uniref:Uncharacterized protein n=1 Tax=Paenibacillus baekrokdamisoli TaxID=1712516 RepID=A0A3G9JC36_9BACL|nr:hypothetical protein [Paenibacillus baekrokdamisoli]MBB3068659.1 hypothetical protein [Paenibacillus baekrokdamisoli]BBH23491.1 hypothetical protein Back11_48360 [Paenibacillus baekrokdamisoli]
MAEKKYEFRKRLEVVHQPNRRDSEAIAQKNEITIDQDWSIAIGEEATPLMMNVAKDLQDYLLVSMNISVRLLIVKNVLEYSQTKDRTIILATKEELPEVGQALNLPRSYIVIVSDRRIIVCGNDERGVGQGSYYLEDLMNLREAPFLTVQEVMREPIFSPRMAHSGWGLDRYPDAHLNAMAHAGIDAILVFVKDVDKTTEGYQDFNYLVDQAALYGLDVYVYSYLISRKHPDELDAEQYYDRVYGKIFEACPRFKGVILVGESCEFPSKDDNTTGVLRLEWPADQPQTKPSPGWWPCTDYPQWLNLLKKVVRKHNQEADIVFWTYNWGWAPEEDRLKLIRNVPEDITLLVTFEMFEQIKHEHVTNVCVDYTISFEGPGQYFSSEAKVAKERGLKLYAMSNTGGLTWDIGVIPYQPVPNQWANRHSALLQANADWGLSGLMESHHYGWWPSFISDITKWTYWNPSPPSEQIVEAIAIRDFSREAVDHVLEAWRSWSEGIRHYVPTIEDQYGPFRIGSSYPFVFQNEVKMPVAWHAMFGNEIIFTAYKPIDTSRQSLGASRYPVEIRSLQRMLELMIQGNEAMKKAIALTPERKREQALKGLGISLFITHAVQTAIHAKQWWLLKQRLLIEPDTGKALAILEEMQSLAKSEIANAQAVIPLVEADSRLGWEPSMDYMTDAEHLHWKINQVRSVIENEFPGWRASLALTD